jgi:hypothetical protein
MVQLKPSRTSSTIGDTADRYSFSCEVSPGKTCGEASGRAQSVGRLCSCSGSPYSCVFCCMSAGRVQLCRLPASLTRPWAHPVKVVGAAQALAALALEEGHFPRRLDTLDHLRGALRDLLLAGGPAAGRQGGLLVMPPLQL